MKKLIVFFISFLLLIASGCKDENRVLSAVQDGKELPEGSKLYLTLEQNFPNPFQGSTEIHFTIYRPMHIKLTVYTEDWLEVKTIIDQDLSLASGREYGAYQYTFSAFDNPKPRNQYLPSGDYYYTLEGGGVTLVRSMRIIK